LRLFVNKHVLNANKKIVEYRPISQKALFWSQSQL